ncbi:hypothetical protein HHI36_022652 [Cryptolaemus montrouzieri]|uniref:C2H2-type domain-containing protein n=1 Tax=Cryptolaemus montrouzieri TaxID=559131 RepID=A0ABD2N0E8_9CUCU
MKRHINTVHLSIKNHRCTVCDFQTTTKSKLKHRINRKHLGQRNHKCSHCDYIAYAKSNLTEHINSLHLGIKITNVANMITAYVITKQIDNILNAHIDTKDLGIKNYKCNHCNYAEYLKCDVMIHLNSVHLCSSCDYQGSAKSLLTKPVKSVHLLKEEYKCSQFSRIAHKKSTFLYKLI